MHYVGRVHGGHVFDSSRAREKEFNFVLGAGGVIKGWERGLPMMKVGETARLVIDPELGYGKKGMPPKIPPDATLGFEIEVWQGEMWRREEEGGGGRRRSRGSGGNNVFLFWNNVFHVWQDFITHVIRF